MTEPLNLYYFLIYVRQLYGGKHMVNVACQSINIRQFVRIDMNFTHIQSTNPYTFDKLLSTTYNVLNINKIGIIFLFAILC